MGNASLLDLNWGPLMGIAALLDLKWRPRIGIAALLRNRLKQIFNNIHDKHIYEPAKATSGNL